MSLEIALKQSYETQLLVAEHLHTLRPLHWALVGGETVDDGKTLRVTIVLVTKYDKENLSTFS